MNVNIVLTKSQKALQDVIELSTSIVEGTQVTFSELPASAEKSAFFTLCDKFNNAVESGNCDKLTVKAMANSVSSAYKRLIKGESNNAASKYQKEVANLKAALLLGVPVDELIKKQDDKENTALYRKNLLLTDKGLQSIINPVSE